MWVFSRHGFISVVAHRDAEGYVLLRHRTKEHADATAEILGGTASVFEDASADYQWRLSATRSELKVLLLSLADGVDYDNFKNAVAATHEEKGPYLTLLHRIWWAGVSALGMGTKYAGGILAHQMEDDDFADDWMDEDPYDEEDD